MSNLNRNCCYTVNAHITVQWIKISTLAKQANSTIYIFCLVIFVVETVFVCKISNCKENLKILPITTSAYRRFFIMKG